MFFFFCFSEAAASNFAGVVVIDSLASFQFCMVRRVQRLCDGLSFPEQSVFFFGNFDVRIQNYENG